MAEAADREEELGRLRDLLASPQARDAGQQRELQDAIDQTTRELGSTWAAQAALTAAHLGQPPISQQSDDALKPQVRPRTIPVTAETVKARRKIMNQLKRGEISLPEVLKDSKYDDVIGRMRVSDLLQSLPGIGKVHAAKIMELPGISESLTVRRLGVNQVAALEQEFGPDL